MRKPFEGVANVVLFNWPYYLASVTGAIIFTAIAAFSQGALWYAAAAAAILAIAGSVASLVATWFVYDHSRFYDFHWLDGIPAKQGEVILNITAGFDETTGILKELFPKATITPCDFYEGDKHTAASIRRARRRYPSDPEVKKISSDHIPFADGSVDRIFAIMAVHEIRDRKERMRFFTEAKRCLMQNGQIAVVEHLRDLPNFLAYNVGAFHFHSRRLWLDAISSSGLIVDHQRKLTPFLTAFFIKHGDPS